MARCMGSAAIAEFPDHDQQVAVCLNTYRRHAKSVKVLDEKAGKIGGWGIPFGGPVKGLDLEGEAFTPDTNFCFDWFPNEGRPLLYEHGTDPTLKLDVIGRQTAKFVDPQQGVWVEAQLNMAHRYAGLIMDLAKKGVLGFSSGALGGYVRRQGEKIMQWPWIEQTLTPRPANPYALIPPDAIKHLEAMGDEPPASLQEALKATWDTAYVNNLPDSAFAVVLDGGKKDSDGKTVPRDLRKLPHHNADGSVDLPHLRNALARAPQTDMPAAAHAEAQAHLEAHAKAEGIGDNDDDDANSSKFMDAVALAKKQLAADDAAGVAVDALLDSIRNAQDAMKALRAGKAGRVMSAKNQQQMHEVMQQASALHDATCDMGDDCPLTNGKSLQDGLREIEEVTRWVRGGY